MVYYEEQYQNERGIVVTRQREMNFIQVVRSVRERYQPFLTEYILIWLCFVKTYQQDPDPTILYTSAHVDVLRKETFFPAMSRQISFSFVALEHDLEGLRVVERMMRLIDDTMVARLQAHYRQHEYGELPPAGEVNLSPQPPPEGWQPSYNADAFRDDSVLMIGLLLLSWTGEGGQTQYEIHLHNGLLLHRFELVRNGALSRSRDPLKRHALAIARVQELAVLTDWHLVESLMHKQRRTLHRSVTELCRKPLL